MKVEKYLEVLDTLKNIIANTEFENHLYSVGGCERDRLMGKSEIKDIDLVLDIKDGGIRFATWLKDNSHTVGSVVIYESFGTAMFHLKQHPDIELEVVHTRSECYRDENSRNPETNFGTIYDDCTRRDFTYNAIYRNVTTNEVCDFNGNSIDDLKNNVLRTCGDPNIIFTEDPLRVLRAIRFANRYGSIIEEKTLQGIYDNAHRLSIISKERISDEITKILTDNKFPTIAIDIFIGGVLGFVIPQLQKASAKSCVYDSMIAQIYSKLTTPSCLNDVSVKLAILLGCYLTVDEVKEVLSNLRFCNNVINKTLNLIRLSNFDDLLLSVTIPSDKLVRRFQYLCKDIETFNEVMTVACSFHPKREDLIDRLIKTTKSMVQDGTDMFNYKLPVSGDDIMKTLNIGPSAEVKEYLNKLLNQAFLHPHITKKELLEILKFL